MSLDVVVVMDPLGSIRIAKDSTFAMLLEAQRRGHRLHYVLPGGLSLVAGVAEARVAALQVRDDPASWFELGPASQLVLGPGHVVLMRTDPPVDADYLHDTQVLGFAQRAGAFVVKLVGSYSAVVGLPLNETVGLLSGEGYPVHFNWLNQSTLTAV